jgi:Tfp pilus assembly protein PilO
MDENKKEDYTEFLVKRGGLVLIAVGWLYALYLAYGFWVSSSGELARLNRQIQPLTKQVQKLREQKSKSEEYIRKQRAVQKELKEMEAQIQAFQRRLPEKFSDGEIYRLMASEFEAINMVNERVAPGEQSNYEFYDGKKYEVEAKGTFLQFLVLLERIQRKDRILDVLDITLSPDQVYQGHQVLKGSLQLEAFRYSEKASEEGAEAEGTQGENQSES